MPSKTQRELAFLLTGKDVSASKAMKGVRKQITGLERHAGTAGTNIARNLERGVVLGAGAAVGAIGYAVKAALDWESAVAGVAKTVDGDVKQISSAILDMSTKVPLAAVELAGLAEQAGALGIAKKDIVAFTEVAATLGLTTNVSALDAATALGQLGNVMHLTAADYERFGSTLVDLGNKGASTEAQILEIARRAGGAAALLEIAADKTLGWSSSLANLGINEELAGTALQSFFLKSLNLVAGGKDGLEALAKVAGTTGKSFKAAFDKDASGALQSFIAGLAKLPKDKRLKTVQALFGKTSGLNRAIIGMAESYDRNLAPSIDTATAAWQKNNAMAIEAEKRYATTASQIQVLKNNVDAAAITIGSELLPMIAELSKEGVDWLQGHQADIAKFSKDLALGIRDAVKWAKSLDWNAIGGAMKAGAGFAKDLVQAFASAPPWLQQFLAVGFVANKFTGGAVMDVTASLGKGLLSGMAGLFANKVLGIQAGVVNVTGGVVNGGGLPAVAGGLPAVAGGAVALSGAAAAGIITISAAAAALIGTAIAGQMFGAQNEGFRSQGLTPAEVAAQRYYSASIAEQNTIAKRLGYVPTKADFASGMAKITGVQRAVEGADGRNAEGAARQAIAIETAKTANTRDFQSLSRQTTAAARETTAASRAAGQQAAAAIRDKDMSVSVLARIATTVNVSAREYTHAATVTEIRSTGGAFGGQ
jgi:TP901 family phage tail tape measure protein